MPRIDNPQQERDSLTKLGMTPVEVEIWDALGKVAGRMLQLPVLHPMEQHETAHDFHKLQLRLLARPGLRAAGWPRGEGGPQAETEAGSTGGGERPHGRLVSL